MSNPPQNNALTEVVELLRKKQYPEAVEFLSPYLQENPNSEDGWFLLSYAIRDPQKKIECLQQVLRINPDSSRAQERLAKLQDIVHPIDSEDTPQIVKETPKPKKKRRWLTYSVSVVLLAIFISLGYFGIKFILPMFRSPETMEIAEAPSVEAANTATLTPSPVPSSTPTSLPTSPPTPSLSPTDIVPTPTEIPPTPARDLPIPQNDLAAQMDDIQNQVSTIREWGIKEDYPRYIIPENKVRKVLNDLILERYTKDDIKDQARVLSALGLIEPTYDLYGKMLNNLGEGLGGFFIPWTDEIFVIGENFGPVEKLVYAHEYLHALSDQHYHLETIGVYPECLQDTDRCNAITALIEGDATYLMYQWQNAYASEEDILAVDEANFAPIDRVITSQDFPPPYTIRETYFKYFDGQNFVAYLYEGKEAGQEEVVVEDDQDQPGSWDRVNMAYDDYPLSSEQILHPEKYLEGEKPIKVQLQPIEALLGDDWRLLTSETLGELTTEMLLGYSANYLVQLDPITAADAAAGWGGDQYQVFYRGKTNHTLLVAQWVWDSPSDSDEFWDAMSDYLNRRYGGREVADIENCWTKINDHFSCIFYDEVKTLWIMAPTLEMISEIVEEYPGFR